MHGVAGPDGPKGPSGEKGNRGREGPVGIQYLVGDQGERGKHGQCDGRGEVSDVLSVLAAHLCRRRVEHCENDWWSANSA